jgi:type III pantothenate kinase
MAARYFDAPCVVVEPGIKTGMPILYENPREVGADRISNAVAAIDLYSPPVIVVDLGTATTFDAISAAGEYLGGAITPGIEISMTALFDRAEALTRIELREPKHAVGRTTVEAMQSGAVFGYAALVDGLCRRIEAEIGPSTIVATGGLSSRISPHSTVVAHVEPWLTLHGLRLIYLRNLDASGQR